MPFKHIGTPCLPLVVDNDYEINNEDLLAEYVGLIVLGHYAHVKKIINTLNANPVNHIDSEIDLAVAKLSVAGKSDNEIEKRDGWVFQMISWLALFDEYKNTGLDFYCQHPHDAPAQHGLDGVAIALNKDLKIENIIITEDKCTTNHRVVIQQQVWKEFKQFEDGQHNNKLVTRISGLIETLNNGNVLEANRNDIYNNGIRKYRLGINRDNKYQEAPQKRLKLFKGYDGCVTGNVPQRRYGATFFQADIRAWMSQFCDKVIVYLNNKKVA